MNIKNGISANRKIRSLSFRLPFLFVASYILIILIVLSLVHVRFRNRMIQEYTRMAKGVTNLMAKELDPSKTEEYMEQNFEMPEYREILDRFYNLKENYPDVLYMYVYRFEADGGHVIFDLDSETGGEGDAPGSVYEVEGTMQPYLEDLTKGMEIPVLWGETQDGVLLSYEHPVFDDEGNYQCHTCVDFSMDYLYKQDMHFLLFTFLTLLAVVVVILVIDILVVQKSVTGPLNKMSECTSQFSYETEQDRFRNIQILEELNLHTNDEIEDLYVVFLSVLKESVYYLTNLSRAKMTIQDKEEKIERVSRKAYEDSLTGLGNKAAYNKEVKALTLDIVNGRAKFAIVMVDINNLKYVNDTFGHESGDKYIKGCCEMVRAFYGNAPIFRMGGDEFVVVLKGEDYENRELCLEQLLTAFQATYQQQEAEPWERYSASAGMSEFVFGDKTVDQVLKRADEAMYAYKMEFKKKYGSYR